MTTSTTSAQGSLPLDLVRATARIVTSYSRANQVAASELRGLIETVHASLSRQCTISPEPRQEAPAPAVPIRRSVTRDHIICLEDGKPMKMLKRHLRTNFGMTPDEYRAKWGLPHDYPMVAPGYSETRSLFAKQVGLGRKR